jgi:hypothetical protein
MARRTKPSVLAAILISGAITLGSIAILALALVLGTALAAMPA